MIKSLKDLLDKLSRFTNSLVYDGGICKRLFKIVWFELGNLLFITALSICGYLAIKPLVLLFLTNTTPFFPVFIEDKVSFIVETSISAVNTPTKSLFSSRIALAWIIE